MSSAKDKGIFGSIVSIVGYIVSVIPGYQVLGYALLAVGAALGYAGARQAQKEAEARARAGRNTADQGIRANIRGGHEHHFMVFGRSRVGGIVAATAVARGGSDNSDFYVGVEHSICHPGGCDGVEDKLWIDNNFIDGSFLSGDPNGGVATVSAASGYPWRALAYAPELGLIAGVGDSPYSSHFTMASAGGERWQRYKQKNSQVDEDWAAVAWGGGAGLFVAVSDLGTDAVLTSPDGITWTERSAVSRIWKGIAWSPQLGRFAAVASSGSGSRVMTSSDGISWAARTTPADNNWQAIAWSPELALFAAVATSGSGNRVMTSPDGITWTIRTSAANNDWQSVAWSPALGLFAAVANTGSGNRVMTSPDGITWTIRTSAANNDWQSVAWSPALGLFAAVAQSGTGNRVMTSPDGITWTIRTSAADQSWRSVLWDGTRFIAVSSTGTRYQAMVSADGINWSLRETAPTHLHQLATFQTNPGRSGQLRNFFTARIGADSETSRRRGIAWSWAKFVRPANDQDFSEAFHFAVPTYSVELRGLKCYDPRKDPANGGSAPADAWLARTHVPHPPSLASGYQAIAWSPDVGLFVATGDGASANAEAILSEDGVSWAGAAGPTGAFVNNVPRSLVWSPGRGIFVSLNGSIGGNKIVLTSPDGKIWTARATPSGFTDDGIAWSESLGLFVTVGNSGNCYTSPDAITWTQRTAAANQAWTSVAWAEGLGLFVAVSSSGAGGRAMTSPDGITWTLRSTPSAAWQSVAWSEELTLLVAVSNTTVSSGRVMTSPDGITWTARVSPTNPTWQAVAWGAELGLFAAVADGGTDRLMTSPDGINWTQATPPDTSMRWEDIAYSPEHELFAAVGSTTASTFTVMTGPHSNYKTLANPENWDWSENPILQAATYSIMAKSDGGWGIPADKIDWASVISAANICDESISTPIGNVPRFTGNGVLSTTDTLEVNLQKILDACLGRRVRVGGKFKFYAAAYRTPTATIDESWLAGPVRVSTRDALGGVYNAVRVNFNDKDRDYQTIDAPPYTNGSYEAQDGGERLWRDVTLPMVSDTFHAQYIGQILGKQSRFQMTLELVCNLKAMDLEVWETCTLDIEGLDLSGRVFRIEHWGFAPNGIAVVLREDASSIYTVGTFSPQH